MRLSSRASPHLLHLSDVRASMSIVSTWAVFPALWRTSSLSVSASCSWLTFSASQPLFIFERVYLIDRGVQSVSKSLHSWGRDPHRVLYCSWHVLAVKGSNRLYRLKWLKDRNIHTDLHWQWIHREIPPLHLLTYKVIQTETSLLCHNVKTSLLFVRKLKLKCKIRQCHSSYVNQYCAAIFSLFHASNVFRNIYQCSV